MITVDVALICYNQESYICKAIESVLSQNYLEKWNVRLIVADDCSTDHTLELIRGYEQKAGIPFEYLVDDHNLGLVKNYQRIFAATKANFLAILEGDDYWYPDHLAQHIHFLLCHPCYSMSSNQIQFFSSSKGIIPCHWPFVTPYIRISLKQQITNGNQLGNLSACVFRTKYIKSIPDEFFELNFADWELGMLMAQHGPIARLREATSVYRENDQGQWVRLDMEKRSQSRIKTIDTMDDFFDRKYHSYFDVVRKRVEQGERFSYTTYSLINRSLLTIRKMLKTIKHKILK